MSRADRRPAALYHRLVVCALFLILVLPLAATLLYSLATQWSATLLPDGLTLKWYLTLWSDQRFLLAFARSLLVCFGAPAFSVLLILPLMFVIHYHFPRLDGVMNVLILLPFAVPPIVSSVGLLQLYASGPLEMIGTPWVLVGCYFTIALPFMYRAITNNLQAINLRDLMDAAHLLGASTWKAALLVVLPNLRKGVMVALLLSFSFLIGEFVFANLLVGTRYETLQVFLNNMRNSSGHYTSAVVVSLLRVRPGPDLGGQSTEQGQGLIMSFVSVEQLDKSYGATSIFRDIDFAAARGEFVTLLGPSGCGKSTLLRCIAGLTEVDSGRILIDGEDVVPLPPQKRGIAMVFQSYALFPNMTVQQNVAFGLRMQKVPAAELKQRVAEAIELVELGEYAARYPHQLSGGQCQRVALARSLVTRPRLLLLDEPLSALDARIRKHLREQIRRIQQELGLTTVFVTHDQEEALTLSDRIVLMNAGRIVQSGDAETLYTAPENAFAAGFIGNYNLLDAEQASRLLGQPCAQQVAIRPESLRLGNEPSEGVPALVRSHSLLGNVIRYRVEAAGWNSPSTSSTAAQTACIRPAVS